MTNMFLERSFDPPLTADGVHAGSLRSWWCLELHNVDWRGSYLALGGARMVCCFSAADAESVRLSLNSVKADTRRLWIGTVHEGPEPVVPNVLVERSFAEPVRLEDIQAQEAAASWCLETHRVRFARTFFSQDRKRMLCLYQAPDSEAVRMAQREAAMPFDSVWAFQQLNTETLKAYEHRNRASDQP